MKRWLLLAALYSGAALAQPAPGATELAQSPAPTANAPVPATQLPKRLAKALAKADGRTQASAIKVHSVGDEYVLIKALGFRSESQALTGRDGKTYDVLKVTHVTTGEKREFWFDISSFFGREFGF